MGTNSRVERPGAEVEEQVFRLAEGGFFVGGAAVADAGDFGGGADESAHDGGTADQGGEVDNVGGGGDAGDQMAEVGGASYHFQPLLQVQFVGDGDLVDGLPTLEKGDAGLVAVGVPVAIEVGRGYPACHLQDGLAVDEQGADDGLFGL